MNGPVAGSVTGTELHFHYISNSYFETSLNVRNVYLYILCCFIIFTLTVENKQLKKLFVFHFQNQQHVFQKEIKSGFQFQGIENNMHSLK